MNYSFFIGIIFSNLLIPYQYAKVKKHKENLEKSLLLLLKNTKIYYTEAIKSELGLGKVNFCVRIFFPCKGCTKFLQKILFGKRFYKVKNIKELADDDLTDNLWFQVNPESQAQGIIGTTYNIRDICYDDDLKNTKEKYKLNAFQKNHTANLKFIVAAPIFNDSSKIRAIVSIDSVDDIKIDEKDADKLRTIMIKYCLLLDKFLPLLK